MGYRTPLPLHTVWSMWQVMSMLKFEIFAPCKTYFQVGMAQLPTRQTLNSHDTFWTVQVKAQSK